MARYSRAGVLLVAVSLVAAACGGHHRAADPPPPAPTTVATTTTTVPAPPGVTTVATIMASIPGHPTLGGPASGTVPSTWYGYPSILPVVQRAPGWVEVRLAQRPNQSTTWVPLADVRLSATPWRLVLSLGSKHLEVFDNGRIIADFPAGIGTKSDPTVTGHYFVAMKVPPPSAGYGAFVLATSAHSDSITDWDSSGDAVIGIHGPIDSYDDSLIGSTGASISHGCIRLHYGDLSQLSAVLAGSPLEVVS